MKITRQLLSALLFLILSFSEIEVVQGQETSVSVEGVIEQIIIEDKIVRRDYILAADNGKRFRLHASTALDKYLKRRVTVTGIYDGNRLNVNEEIKIVEENQANLNPPPPTFGSRKVLVLLINFINDQTQPLTVEQVRTTIFTGANSANSYFKEASYYRYNLTGIERPDGDVVGWLTLPTLYSSQECYLLSDWTDKANTLSRQNGYEPNNYNSVVYVFNRVCGGLYAMATGGIVGGPPWVERIWLASHAIYDANAIVHELGHNLGLGHANSFACSGTDIPNSCRSSEYGDPFDAMGRPSFPIFFNNYYRRSLGWLTGRTEVVTASGDYNILPPSVPTKGNQVLQIPLKLPKGELTNYSYYLEFRRPLRFDIPLPYNNYSQPVYRGICIRYGFNEQIGFETNLIDTVPNTPTLYDAPLTAGNTFTDTRHGVTITTLSTNPVNGARVRIQLSR